MNKKMSARRFYVRVHYEERVHLQRRFGEASANEDRQNRIPDVAKVHQPVL